MPTREAHVVWDGDLRSGKGNVSADSSGTFSNLPVSWASRTESPNSQTSPEELVAAAHASCFAMALSAGLGRSNTPPERLEVSAAVSFERVGEGYKVTSSALQVRGRVPGIDQAAFQQAAEGARDNCPVSQALKGNVELSVRATLEG